MAELKRVSFKVAKTIKEAGYNVPCDMYYHIYDDEYESETSLEMTGTGSNDFINSLNRYRCAAPTYLEVWLWLWREKKIKVSLDLSCETLTSINADFWIGDIDNIPKDPEEAIIAAIEYLADNDLIK